MNKVEIILKEIEMLIELKKAFVPYHKSIDWQDEDRLKELRKVLDAIQEENKPETRDEEIPF